MKKCFKCDRELPLTDFYKHKMMSDGHLNKCKDLVDDAEEEDIEMETIDDNDESPI